MGQRSLRDATLKLIDGNAVEITVKIGEGNITWTERRNIEYIRDRGVIDTVRLGDDEPVDVSFDFVWDWIFADTTTDYTDALPDIIKGNSPFETSSADACEPYACNIEVTLTACSTTEVITLADFRYEELSYDLRNGTISCSGKCNISELAVAAS